jgi:hypothetical protein
LLLFGRDIDNFTILLLFLKLIIAIQQAYLYLF